MRERLNFLRCMAPNCFGQLSLALLLAVLLSNSKDRFVALAVDLEDCNVALGMETGEIPDQDISASSSFDDVSVGPQSSRIRTEKAGGAWCPKNQISRNVHEWLQVNFHTPRLITGIETQGRYGHGNGVEYAPEYILEYWRPGLTHWVRYKSQAGEEVIEGNKNTFTSAIRELDSPIIASKIRIVPWSNHPRTICMRIEIYGCDYRDNLLSYSIPQGVRLPDLDLRDLSYDGKELKPGILSEGTGQLFDGFQGKDNFKLNPTEWVGWKNSTSGARIYAEFHFAESRNFTSMHLHANNRFSDGAQVFKSARLFFSTDGKRYSKIPVVFLHEADTTSEAARWVKIPISGGRLARVIKVELVFASKFLLISEARFDSRNIVAASAYREAELTQAEGISGDVIPILFDGENESYFGVNSGYDTQSNAESGPATSIVSLGEMPAEYVGLVVGITLSVAACCGVFVLVMMLRNKHKPHLCQSTYESYAGSVSPNRSIKNMQLVLGKDGSISTKALRSDTSATLYILDMENEEIGKLPASPPPKHLPCGQSPPPEYRSHCSESSEYAEPDSPCKDYAPEAPLLPPPPQSQRRRLCTATQATGNCASLNEVLMLPPSTSKTSFVDDNSTSLLSCMTSSNMPSPSQWRNSLIQGTVGNSTYVCTEVNCGLASPTSPCNSVAQIGRHKLKFREKLGEGEFGEVHLCEYNPRTTQSPSHCKQLVAVKLLRKNATDGARNDFQKEMRIMAKLKDSNIVQLLGVCSTEEPWFMVVEYMENGDLNQYLQRNAANLETYHLTCVAAQISSGMKYLESLNFVHRDLAARNCLVGRDLTIKIADFGMARSLYSSDYYRIEGKFVLPIRWMSWETILLGKFTPRSDVWAFGVTLWEIFTFSSIQPFAELSDDQVIENIKHIYHSGELQFYLPIPANCPKDFYDLMLACWQRDELQRPSFHEMTDFLCAKASLLESGCTTASTASIDLNCASGSHDDRRHCSTLGNIEDESSTHCR